MRWGMGHRSKRALLAALPVLRQICKYPALFFQDVFSHGVLYNTPQVVQLAFLTLQHRLRSSSSPPHIVANVSHNQDIKTLSLIHISEPTRRTPISYAVFCLKKKNIKRYNQ